VETVKEDAEEFAVREELDSDDELLDRKLL